MIEIFIKMIPLIILVFLGFILQKGTKSIDVSVLGKLSLYILTPSVLFLGAYKTPFELTYLIVPLFIFVLVTSITLLLIFISQKFFPKSSYTVPAFVSATSNVGYFGLPLVLALYGESALSLAVLGMMGFGLSESTIGAFVMAHGNHGTQKAIKTVVKLPNVWLFLLGVLFNFLAIPLPEQLMLAFDQLKITYITIGMLLIGVSFASLKIATVNWLQVGKMLAVKHIWQPMWFLLLMPLFIIFLPFDPTLQKILLIQSFCPIAGNIIVYSAVFNQKTNDSVIALLISTILAFITIPLFITIFL